MRKTITKAAIAAMALTATVALAGSTPEQKCQAAKNSAAGKYAACRQSAEKGLVSTGDATKYGASIAKCEEKFAAAWQKAIDSAAADGTVCPDAPLAADDYKSVIDTHSGNVATALQGGGLTTASSCGNGTIEAGEDCDFGTLGGATCSTATAGGAPYGTLSCGAGCAFDSGECVPCPGRMSAGSCWLLSGEGGACTAACASAGLAYDPATGSGDCLELARVFNPGYEEAGSPWGPLSVQSVSLTGIGCCDFNGPPTYYRDSQPTLGDASDPSFARFCACR